MQILKYALQLRNRSIRLSVAELDQTIINTNFYNWNKSTIKRHTGYFPYITVPHVSEHKPYSLIIYICSKLYQTFKFHTGCSMTFPHWNALNPNKECRGSYETQTCNFIWLPHMANSLIIRTFMWSWCATTWFCTLLLGGCTIVWHWL
jgi:hypothetical protein